MPARMVISLVVDLIGSTKTGLEMHDLQFRNFNRALIGSIWPYFSEFGLVNSTIKFTGDGWLLFNPELEKAHSVVALAKTLAASFQSKLAESTGHTVTEVPPLRLAICTGSAEEISFGVGQREWVGDSARRATRAANCCGPNELIVNSGPIRDTVLRIFQTTRINISALPVERRPRHMGEEEDLELYVVGEMLSTFVTALRAIENPAEYAPYVTYLGFIDRLIAAKQVFTTVTNAVMTRSGLESGKTPGSPAELAALSEVGGQLRKLLYAAPNREMRDIVVSQWRGSGFHRVRRSIII